MKMICKCYTDSFKNEVIILQCKKQLNHQINSEMIWESVFSVSQMKSTFNDRLMYYDLQFLQQMLTSRSVLDEENQ